MAVKIRLARGGRKNAPIYKIVVADTRSPRDGKFIKKIGTYNPHTNPRTVELNKEDALFYLINGAQPTPTTKSILSDEGILLKKHLQIGVIKGKITQQQADKKFEEWLKEKETKLEKQQKSATKQQKSTIDSVKEVKPTETKTSEIKTKQEKPAEVEQETKSIETNAKVTEIRHDNKPNESK